MHHQDFSGDPPGSGSRKTSHATVFHHRRGSSGASASSLTGVSSGEDNPTQAGSSSPGLHHQPQSQVVGAQVKKKSGFQITSVTSAQISVSGNNSLADDTESYDDMDESHTEDLSSSEMLDVSVSRATDTGVPERSSSEETLNSLHGVDTPGLVSPNEPLHLHSIPQGSQQQPTMVNGTVHYPQHHHHGHHPDKMGGGEVSMTPAGATLPVAPLASSSPGPVSKAGAGPGQSRRPPVLDNTRLAGVAAQPLATVVGGTASDTHVPGTMNITGVSAVSAMPATGIAGFDSTSVSGQGVSSGVGAGPSAAPSAQSQPTQTQAAGGSRFRVVKLDTNSEPFRKGRWTCTEYYEKEIPSTTVSETCKGTEAAAETEPGSGGTVVASPSLPAVQPPHTLQPYQQPSQDFTSPQPMQSPPQGLVQNAPLTHVLSQEVGGGHMPQKPMAPVALPTATPQAMAQLSVSQPPSVMPQQLSYAVEPHQAQPQVGYPTPQVPVGGMAPSSVRQPDFIQPTAPFQTQVQPPLPHVTPGVSMTMGPGGATQPPVTIAQQLPLQGQSAPPAQAIFAPGQAQALPTQPQQPQPQLLPQVQAQLPSSTPAPVAPTQGTSYMPLTALQADLQPLLTPGAALTQTSGAIQAPGIMSSFRSTQLEDAQRLLSKHQGLLGLPRLGAVAGGDGAAEAGGAAGSLAHMGMGVEASALMAAAAGLRTQPAEGEEDSSSGASVVAIDNKIEQAMDLVKSHLMYAVREEVEVLKEQIKELIERNSQLEQENNLLKTLASPEQMAQFQAQVQTGGSPTGTTQPPAVGSAGTALAPPSTQNSGTSA
ncbi:TSC22 domain family protein 1 isoform X1 [Myripristis murdjan]|uniref:TSC22 domain family protein 1 isoform X1 n=1 Tax=Myripristis murdjan TaxID=586833 RepID=UPI001175DF09|nr:TSC22 domain family protein 1-like isoform X1 [Myripristis murdjan]